MSWMTKDYIFEVLGKDRLESREIMGKLEMIGQGEKYNTINKHLRQMVNRKQLSVEREGRRNLYHNPKYRKN